MTVHNAQNPSSNSNVEESGTLVYKLDDKLGSTRGGLALLLDVELNWRSSPLPGEARDQHGQISPGNSGAVSSAQAPEDGNSPGAHAQRVQVVAGGQA